MNDSHKQLRKLPSVDRILGRRDVAGLIKKEGRKPVADAVRSLLGMRRRGIIEGGGKKAAAGAGISAAEISGELARLRLPSIRKVVNATGIVVHTNLGRSPLPASSLEYLAGAAGGFCNLEYTLEEGRRGSRYDHIEEILSEITGAEAAHVVNNNAAALLLAASAVAKGKEIIVSRGELIEIGDGFRLPEVIVQSGADLREVGTTNRTQPVDYERAIGERTGMIIKAHRSNFFMDGFVQETTVEEVADIGRRHSIPVLFDIGSGALDLPENVAGSGEPRLRSAVKTGVDLVTCSGDKLLGGPQAGLIVGEREIVKLLRHHPMTRALRPCKLTIALLNHVLLLYKQERYDEIPVYRMISRSAGELEKDARSLARRLGKALAGGAWSVEVIEERSKVGGGALPREHLDTWTVSLRHRSLAPQQIDEKLRLGKVPVIARIKNDRIILDVRTLTDEDRGIVVEALRDIGT